MTSWIGVRRLVAFGVDWLVIALWGGALFGAVMVLSGGHVPSFSSPWTGQAIGFATMTVPVTLYFAISESSRAQASVGKRLLRLRVTTMSGGRLPLARSLLRSCVKFVPWECGHVVPYQTIYAGDDQVSVWVWGIAVVSLGLALMWVLTVLLRNRTPYDAWSGASVIVMPQRQ